jgi:hypothetical protein
VEPTEKFDLTSVMRRNAQILGAYLKVSFGDQSDMVVGKLAEGLPQMIRDFIATTGEVQRMYEALKGMKGKHMPFAGEPGAPAICTSCSLHGGQVPWPCETYNAAVAALPEGER